MSTNPEWTKSLPSFPLLTKRQIEILENLRIKYSILHNDFLLAVLGSPVFTLITQKDLYQKLKSKYPNNEEKQILKLILKSRYFEKTEDEIDTIMNKIYSFNDLCNYVIKQDKLECPYHKPGIVNKCIDDILTVTSEI